jgi:serine/threonine protein kinase
MTHLSFIECLNHVNSNELSARTTNSTTQITLEIQIRKDKLHHPHKQKRQATNIIDFYCGQHTPFVSKLFVVVNFFFQLWPFVLFKKYYKYVKSKSNLKYILTIVKHVTKKIDDTCIIFWIRRTIKVVDKSQWRQMFWYGGSISHENGGHTICYIYRHREDILCGRP